MAKGMADMETKIEEIVAATQFNAPATIQNSTANEDDSADVDPAFKKQVEYSINDLN